MIDYIAHTNINRMKSVINKYTYQKTLKKKVQL